MTAVRRTLAAAGVGLALSLVAACGGGDPGTESTSSPSSSRSDDCSQGAVRFLQGQPTDLPGGGSGGIGQVYADDDPPTVDLAIGVDGSADVPRQLAVGDRFRVLDTTYRIVCISPSKVTADTVSS